MNPNLTPSLSLKLFDLISILFSNWLSSLLMRPTFNSNQIILTRHVLLVSSNEGLKHTIQKCSSNGILKVLYHGLSLKTQDKYTPGGQERLCLHKLTENKYSLLQDGNEQVSRNMYL